MSGTGQSVTVLTPNGRRQTVKVASVITLLQILEQVCEKHGFDPDEFDIKHHNKILDVNMLFKFSGLPNNAFLEMSPVVKKRTLTPVIVGLLLESGERVTGEFLPTTNLWNIIENLKPDELFEKNTVVVYMSRQIFGRENLQNTTLKTLGLSSGRGMLRIIHKTEDEMKTQANVSSPLVRAVPDTTLHVAKQQHKSESASNETSSKNSCKTQEGTLTKQKIEDKSNVEKSVFKTKIEAKVDFCEPSCSKQPDMKQVAEIKEINPDLQKSRKDLNKKIANISEDLEKFRKEINLLGERQAIAYNLDSIKREDYEDLPDEFFELTVADAKLLMKQAKQAVEELENTPLQTASQRELENNRRMLNMLHSNKKTVIRIRFPDRTVLQGSFSPVESVARVHEFVRKYLTNPDLKFYLYTSPPKEILNVEQRLFEVNCVPSSIVYFGVSDGNAINGECYLRRDVLDKLSTLSAACLTALESRGVTGTSDNNASSTTSKDRRDSANKSEKSPPNKVPKWFKTSK